MKRKSGLVLILLIALVSFLFPQFSKDLNLPTKDILSEFTADQVPSPTIQIQNGQVTRVVDGDTIDVYLNGNTEKIRIIGINTPETVDPRKPMECFGRQASEHAKSLLTGKVVTLQSDETQANKDRYGRLLRYVALPDGSDFGLKMIQEGYAYEYTYEVPYIKQEEYKNAQTQAEENRRGLWGEICN